MCIRCIDISVLFGLGGQAKLKNCFPCGEKVHLTCSHSGMLNFHCDLSVP